MVSLIVSHLPLLEEMLNGNCLRQLTGWRSWQLAFFSRLLWQGSKFERGRVESLAIGLLEGGSGSPLSEEGLSCGAGVPSAEH